MEKHPQKNLEKYEFCVCFTKEVGICIFTERNFLKMKS